MQLGAAKNEAESSAAAFTAKRDALRANIQTKTQPPEVLSESHAPPARDDFAGSHEVSAKQVSETKRRAATLKAVTSLEERIENQKNLAETRCGRPPHWRDILAVAEEIGFARRPFHCRPEVAMKPAVRDVQRRPRHAHDLGRRDPIKE